MAEALTIPLDDNFGVGDGVADTAPDPVEDSPENLQKKADEYDARNAGEATEEEVGTGVPPMPADGHAKFYNKDTGAYNWKDHSTELQYRLNQKAEPPTAPKKVEIKEPAKGEKVDPVVQMQTTFDTMAEDFQTNGELSGENRGKLNEMGIPDGIINTYLSGLQATNELVSAKSTEIMGSQDKLDAVMNWASNNLNAVQREAINSDLANPDMLEITLLGLQARYNSAIETGGEVPLIDGDAVGSDAAVEAYEDAAQSRVDMKNPLYKTSAKFRQQVLAKIQAASEKGVAF